MKEFKVLMVDDEEDFVTTLSERMKLRDVDSDVALDGEQALQRVEDETTIESSDLADFLFLFRGAYAAGIPSVEKIRAAGNEPDPNTLADKIRKRLAKLTVSQINDLFQQDLGPNRLLTERISRDSPFEIVLYGTIILLVLAVILSGGRFELGPGGVKAHLPPMGKGIKHLREALTWKTRVS